MERRVLIRILGAGRYWNVLLMCLIMASLVFAVDTITAVASMVTTIYCTLTQLFPILVFTLFMLSAVAYGIGQFFGADTRAKASTWAMACLTATFIMLVIYLIGPMVISSLYKQVDTSAWCV